MLLISIVPVNKKLEQKTNIRCRQLLKRQGLDICMLFVEKDYDNLTHGLPYEPIF